MARIKRHFSANLVGSAGTVTVLTVCVLWVSANPLECVEREADVSAGQRFFVPVSSNPVQVVNNSAPALLQVEAPQPVPFTMTRQVGAETLQPVAPDNPPLLDGPRQYALGMIETGNDDKAIGRAGEVSRYQIMPSVWDHYTDSRDYHDADVSLEVARRHWSALCSYFKLKTNREPTDFDVYVLWNTRHGYYERQGFDPARVNPVVRDRAQRFTNLVELGESREARIMGNKGA
jgi:hypothetical protein